MSRNIKPVNQTHIAREEEGLVVCGVPFDQQRLNDIKAVPASTKSTGINCTAISLYVAGFVDAELCLYYSDMLAEEIEILKKQMAEDRSKMKDVEEEDKSNNDYLNTAGFDEASSKVIVEFIGDVIEGESEVGFADIDEKLLVDLLDELEDNMAVVVSFGGKNRHVIVLWKHGDKVSVIDAQRGSDYAGNTMNAAYKQWADDWARDILTQTPTYLKVDCANFDVFRTYCRAQGEAWGFYEGDQDIQYDVLSAIPKDFKQGITINQLPLDNVHINQHSPAFVKQLKEIKEEMRDEEPEKRLIRKLKDAPRILVANMGGRRRKRRTYRAKKRRMTRRR